jgi:Tol biopolymer transport system component
MVVYRTGNCLLFNSWRDADMEVHVIDADGRNRKRMTDSPGEDFNAGWQPLKVE